MSLSVVNGTSNVHYHL